MEKFNFITATNNFNTFEEFVPAPYIRKIINTKDDVEANLTICVCGFYRIFINGTEITKGYLAPYVSNTDDYVYYDKYRIKLDKGENVIGIILGNGFQNNPGGYIWDFDKAPFRSAPKMALNIKYVDIDGEKIEILSDSSFKTFPSPIRSDDYRFGEIYDSNYEIAGWNEKDFDDSKWHSMLETTAPKGEYKLCEADPVIEISEVKAIDIFKENDGYVYDFGVSNSGVCRLCVNGEKGQKIELQHADLLKNGKFYVNNTWFVRDMNNWERDKNIVHKDIYICKGEVGETYTPLFTYHGFRYVKVFGINDEQATPDLLTFIVIHSDIKSRGNFSCSDQIVNKLQEMTRRSDLSNFHYFPTDCPHREKNGWTADAALSCEQMLLNFEPENNYREWLFNIRKAQTFEGALPGIVPTTGWGFEWGNGPAWDCVLAYLPYYTYVYRGETQLIKESIDSFMLYLNYLVSRKDSNGLMHIGLGDWCHVGRDEPKAPLEVTDTIISMDIADKMAFMFDVVGLADQCEFASSISKRFKKAIRDNLIDYDSMIVKGNCQSCQAMGLFYGIFEEEERNKAFNVLLDLIYETDEHIDVGVLGGRVIFHVLSEFGYSDLAYKMITRPDYPSYGNWIQRGATTLWENFDPDFVDSPNHHFWGDISSWFIKNIAGLNYNPNKNNLHELVVKPSFISNINNANAYYDSCYGKISVSWERKNNNIILDINIPFEINATVKIDYGYKFEDGSNIKLLDSGRYILIKN